LVPIQQIFSPCHHIVYILNPGASYWTNYINAVGPTVLDTMRESLPDLEWIKFIWSNKAPQQAHTVEEINC